MTCCRIDLIQASQARHRITIPRTIEEKKLGFFQRLQMLVLSIFKGFVSFFQRGTNRIESTTISQEAWKEFLYGNRFHLRASSSSSSTSVPPQEVTLLEQFIQSFEAGKQLYKLGRDEICMKLKGGIISPRAFGFVVKHFDTKNIVNPQSSDITACFRGSQPNLRLVADTILSLQVRKDDGARNLFSRIVQWIRATPLQPHAVEEILFI